MSHDNRPDIDDGHRRVAGITSATLRAQGVYYAITGIWPLLGINTFQKMTGPKTDLWLVKTVGALVTVIGTVLLMLARRGDRDRETVVLSAGSALGLAGIDAVYVAKHRISPVYLLDALLQLGFVAAWIRGRGRSETQTGIGTGAS